jgi:AcrR family transcriptional regulator
VGYRHSRDEIVAAAAEVALEHGLAGLTYAKVASQLDISDRMVVYYLPSKTDLLLAAATALGGELMAVLDDAFGSERREPAELVRAAWPVLTTPRAARVFAVFFEVLGQAAAGRAPFDQLAPQLLDGWARWLAERVTGSTAAARRRRALAVMATVDGLLLLRHTLGPDAADDAARELGAC